MFKRIIPFENAYAGKKVLYIGTGCSILDFDFNKVRKDIYTFGLNRIIPFGSDIWKDFRLDFYMCHDPTVMHMSFFDQLMQRKTHSTDEEFDLDNDLVQKYKDMSTSKFIIDSQIYKNTKIIFPENILTPHGERFNIQDNKTWIENNKLTMDQNDNFLVYVADPSPPKPQTKNPFAVVSNEKLHIKTWAKNSFCNSALPLLIWMGFSEIYLAGVDYNNKGNFFSMCKSHQGFANREFDDLNLLTMFAKTKDIKIFSINHPESLIETDDGKIDFSQLQED